MKVLSRTVFLGFLAAATVRAGAGDAWENSLGLRFVPVTGTSVWFSTCLTRVQDFEQFHASTHHDATAGVFSMTLDGGKQIGASWREPGFDQRPDCPVLAVSWTDAQAFCAWLTAKERAEGRLTATQRYRLPTDAEWSVAAGLVEDPSGTPAEKSDRVKAVYPWGRQWPPPDGAANYAGDEARTGIWPRDWGVLDGYHDAFPRSSPVDAFPANAQGLHDMGGNVWQWCEDLFAPDSPKHVLRGASFLSHFPEELQLSHRMSGNPDGRGVFLGFRIVREELAPKS